jgi:hypothetical protein
LNLKILKGNQMPKYVACLIIEVDEKYKERRNDKDMIKRYLANVVFSGAVEEKAFRGNVTMKVKNVKIEVQEV